MCKLVVVVVVAGAVDVVDVEDEVLHNFGKAVGGHTSSTLFRSTTGALSRRKIGALFRSTTGGSQAITNTKCKRVTLINTVVVHRPPHQSKTTCVCMYFFIYLYCILLLFVGGADTFCFASLLALFHHFTKLSWKNDIFCPVAFLWYISGQT